MGYFQQHGYRLDINHSIRNGHGLYHLFYFISPCKSGALMSIHFPTLPSFQLPTLMQPMPLPQQALEKKIDQLAVLLKEKQAIRPSVPTFRLRPNAVLIDAPWDW